MLNPEVVEYTEYYKNQYNNTGYVEIFNFLEAEHFNEFYEWYDSKMPKKWWLYSFLPNKTVFPKNKTKAEEGIRDAQKKMKANIKSHFYSQSGGHYKHCSCYECKTINGAFESKEIIDFIKEITGVNIKKSKNIICKKFESGNFISNDKDVYYNNILYFEYDLTKWWNVNLGGIKITMNEHNEEVEYVEIPCFNKFTLKNHKQVNKTSLVSQVIPNLNNQQYKITGFFE